MPNKPLYIVYRNWSLAVSIGGRVLLSVTVYRSKIGGKVTELRFFQNGFQFALTIDSKSGG